MSNCDYVPPYTITPTMIGLIEQIGEALGVFALSADAEDLRLRRIHRIQTIRGSLAIEGNTLTEEQISTILDGKPVIAPPREVQEARNAIKAYDEFQNWNPAQQSDLLKAHETLMLGLLDAPGHYRSGGVGVGGPSGIVHMAPPPSRVPELIADLFGWLAATDEHALIKSCVFHYEFEFIHPFADGNGRMGRLWQTLLLCRWNPVFGDIAVESMIHEHQQDYYDAINRSNAAVNSGPFIEFMLQVILESIQTDQVGEQVSDQVKRLLAVVTDRPATAAGLMEMLGLSHRPTLRKNYLHPAMAAGLVEMTQPDSPKSPTQKYRLTEKGRMVLRDWGQPGDWGQPVKRSIAKLGETEGSQRSGKSRI